MKKLSYFWPILIEILQVPFIITLFKVVPNKQFAGVLGGVFFLLVSFGLVGHFYKKLYTKSFAVWALLGNVFLFIIPIFVFRLSFWGTPFEEIVFMGINASMLHSLSEKYFVIVLWASVYDCTKIMKNGGLNYFNEETGQPQL